MCFGITVDGDVIDICESHTGLGKTVVDGLSRKACPVLDTPEALLLRRGDHFTIAYDACRCIAVIGIEAKNEHSVAPDFSPLAGSTWTCRNNAAAFGIKPPSHQLDNAERLGNMLSFKYPDELRRKCHAQASVTIDSRSDRMGRQ